MAIAASAEAASGAPASDARVYTGLRLVRTAAMLSIVAYHIHWRPVFGVAFGLTSLQVVTCALVARRTSAPALGPFVRKRALRLLAPWAFWSAVYVAFEVVRAVRWGDAPASRLGTWMLGCGGAYHLWFLPFAFVASLVVLGVQRVAQGLERGVSVALFASLGAALTVTAEPLKHALAPAVPFGLWIEGMPAVAFGLALGRTLSRDDVAVRQRDLLGIALVSALPALLPVLQGLAPESIGLAERYAMGVPIVCLGLLVRVPESRVLRTLASANLGVYLVHVLAIVAIERLADGIPLDALPRFVPVYALSLVAVFAVRRLRIPHIA